MTVQRESQRMNSMPWRGHSCDYDEAESGLGLASQGPGQLVHSYSSPKTQFKSHFIEDDFPDPPSHAETIVFSFNLSMLLSELLQHLLVYISISYPQI